MESEIDQADAPAISSELLGPPPRKVRITGNGLTLVSVTAIIIASAAIYSCFITVEVLRQAQTRTVLRGADSEATGMIEKLHQPYPLKEYVDYTFDVDGKTYRGRAIVPLEDYHSIKSASSLSIRYVAEDPALNHPVDWSWSIMSEWDPFLSVLLFAGTGCLVFIVPQMKFERKLAAKGVATIGSVTRCSVRGRGGSFIRLNYDFRTQDGILAQGSGDFNSRQKIGAKILILYLAEKPKHNVPYPLSTWRITKY